MEKVGLVLNGDRLTDAISSVMEIRERDIPRLHARDHHELAEFIGAQGYPWLISYDDHPRVRQLYGGVQMQRIYLDYKAKSRRWI